MARISHIEGAEVGRIAGNTPGYKQLFDLGTQNALGSLYKQLGPLAEGGIGKALIDYTHQMGFSGNESGDVLKARAVIERSSIRPLNKRAERVRDMKRSLEDPNWLQDTEMEKAMVKSVLDVGTLTNFASITGGQALGYVSLDTRMARGTVRPSSFTLYQALDKSLAWQVVDFWALAKATGGAPTGAAFANYTSVTSGALATSAGTYDLLNIVLKLALDGRAITTALAAQNNYVNVSEQENTNAALTVLSTVNWASYWGDATLYTNQFDGIYKTLINQGYSANIFDYYAFSNANSTAHSWSPELTLYNLIYEAAAQITNFSNFGHVTHAFMSPVAMGALQALTNTQLNNIISQITELQDRSPLVVNGNLIGMQTRFGHIQFPMDMFIDWRNTPVQAIVVDSANQATTSGPTPPVSVTGVVVTGTSASGSEFNGSYTPAGGGSYMYAVASENSSALESVLTYSALVSGVASGNAVTLTITPPVAADAVAFRVFRSGLGGCLNNASPTANEFRYVGAVAANGGSTVTFTDLNGGGTTFIPGSTSIFLLDMDPMDLAIDYRLLLPLVRVELFANNLFMPWAVASIGAVRLRVPKFHGMIKNYVPTNPSWNPLVIN